MMKPEQKPCINGCGLKDKWHKTKGSWVCRECANKSKAKHKYANLEKYLENNRRQEAIRQAKNPEKFKARKRRYRLKKYVYIHQCIKTGEVFYIGSGAKDRAMAVLSNRPKNWVDIMKNKNFKVILACSFSNIEDARSYERFLIQRYWDIGEAKANQILPRGFS